MLPLQTINPVLAGFINDLKCGTERDRTADILNAIQALSQREIKCL